MEWKTSGERGTINGMTAPDDIGGRNAAPSDRARRGVRSRVNMTGRTSAPTGRSARTRGAARSASMPSRREFEVATASGTVEAAKSCSMSISDSVGHRHR